MVKLLFFPFPVTISRLKNKKNSLRVTNFYGWTFIFSLSNYEQEVDKWKQPHKYYCLNFREPLYSSEPPITASLGVAQSCSNVGVA